MSNKSTRKKFDPHTYQAGSIFPSWLWYAHCAGESPGDSPPLPDFLDEQARKEIMRTQEQDERSLTWWAQAWMEINSPDKADVYDLAIMQAMSVVYGLPKTAAALRSIGATTDVLPHPEQDQRSKWGDRWQWGKGNIGYHSQRRVNPTPPATWSCLALCVEALRSDTTTNRLHPDQEQALEELMSAGSDPNLVPGTILKKAIKHEHLVNLLAESGLDPYLKIDRRSPQSGETFLVEALMDDTLTLARAGRLRIMKIFLENGMAERAPDGQHILDIAGKHAHGRRLIPTILNHFGNSIQEAVRERREVLQKGAKRWSEEDRRLLDQAVWESSTPDTTNTKGIGERRMRL